MAFETHQNTYRTLDCLYSTIYWRWCECNPCEWYPEWWWWWDWWVWWWYGCDAMLLPEWGETAGGPIIPMLSAIDGFPPWMGIEEGVANCKFAKTPLLAGPTPKLSQLIQANLAVRSDVFHSMLPSVLISPRRHLSMYTRGSMVSE